MWKWIRMPSGYGSPPADDNPTAMKLERVDHAGLVEAAGRKAKPPAQAKHTTITSIAATTLSRANEARVRSAGRP
jgi:hypothetical protein